MSALNGDTFVILHHLLHSLGQSLYCSIIILSLKFKKCIKMQVVTLCSSLSQLWTCLLLVNVYGPNRDSPEFYDKMEDHVIEMGL